MKDTDDIDIFRLNDKNNIYIIIEPRISFKVYIEKMELIQDDIIYSDSAKAVIKFMAKEFKIFYNNGSKELRLSSFINKHYLILNRKT